KIGKTSGMVFAAGTFVVLAGILGNTYYQQGQEQTLLKAQLSQTQTRIAGMQITAIPDDLVSQEKDLESSIKKSQVQFDGAKSALTKPVDSIEMTAAIAKLATDAGVTMVSVDSPGVTGQDLMEFAFSELTLNVRAEGDVPKLIEFTFLVGKQFPTGVIKSVEVLIPDNANAGLNPKSPSVSLVVLIYSYEDSNG
ncbi:MAG: hypothetical protein Q7T05_03030, partial [Dehalococcoidia bacterium]|nr:hypothetical protein [Dehalococcoidia bacterium]